MKDMISYYGLNCEKCDAYLAIINDDQVLREKTVITCGDCPDMEKCQIVGVLISVPVSFLLLWQNFHIRFTASYMAAWTAWFFVYSTLFSSAL